VAAISINAQEIEFPKPTGPYLGQWRPGDTPELFLKDIIGKNCQLHSSPVFSPDGIEVYWTEMGKDDDGVFFMKCINNKWSPPKKFHPSPKFICADPFISPDGQRLYFAAQFFPDYDEKILYCEREGDGWSQAKSTSEEINVLDLHWQMTVDNDYNLYFHVRNEERTSGDIYYSEYINGSYKKPEKLGSPINTEAWEQFPYISPDGSYLIFARETAAMGYDLFISYKDNSGNWQIPLNMGKRINSRSDELYPILTHDGKYLFFLGDRDGISGAYWVNAKIIEELKAK
jgi:Tol biopolymer transport system component